MVHNWYDLQRTGMKNDYCRFVGSPAYFSCALAGDTQSEYSTRDNKVDKYGFSLNYWTPNINIIPESEYAKSKKLSLTGRE